MDMAPSLGPHAARAPGRCRPFSGVLPAVRPTPASSSCITMMLTSIGDRRSAGLDHVVRRFAIERIARAVEVAQAAQRIGHLQQGPLDVVAQSPKQILGRGSQIDDVEVLRAADTPIGLAQHRAAAGRHARRAASPARSAMTAARHRESSSSPSRSKYSRIEQPMRCSTTWSLSTKGKLQALRQGAGRLQIFRRRASRRARPPRGASERRALSARRCGR